MVNTVSVTRSAALPLPPPPPPLFLHAKSRSISHSHHHDTNIKNQKSSSRRILILFSHYEDRSHPSTSPEDEYEYEEPLLTPFLLRITREEKSWHVASTRSEVHASLTPADHHLLHALSNNRACIAASSSSSSSAVAAAIAAPSLAYEFRVLSHLHRRGCRHVPSFAVYCLDFESGVEQLLEPVLQPMDEMMKHLPLQQSELQSPELQQQQRVELILSSLPTALDSLHAAGIVHADLKPAHICWNQAQPRVEIMDFDLATPVTSLDPLPLLLDAVNDDEETSPNSKNVVEAAPSIAFRGNISYASLRSHFGMQCCSSSDCESAIYICLETLVQNRFPAFHLPWSAPDDDESEAAIHRQSEIAPAASEHLQPSPRTGGDDAAAFEELSKWLDAHTGSTAVSRAGDIKLRYLLGEEVRAEDLSPHPLEETALFATLYGIARPHLLALLLQYSDTNIPTTTKQQLQEASSSSHLSDSHRLQSRSSPATEILREAISVLLSACSSSDASRSDIDASSSQPLAPILPRGLSSSDVHCIESKLAASIHLQGVEESEDLDILSAVLAPVIVRESTETAAFSQILFVQDVSACAALSTSSSPAPSSSSTAYCAFELVLDEPMPLFDDSEEPNLPVEQLPFFFPSLWAQAQEAEQRLMECLLADNANKTANINEDPSHPSPILLLVNPIIVAWILSESDTLGSVSRFFQAVSKAADAVKQLFPLLTVNAKLKRVLVLCTKSQLNEYGHAGEEGEDSFDATAVALLHQVAAAAARTGDRKNENDQSEQVETNILEQEREDIDVAIERPWKRTRR